MAGDRDSSTIITTVTVTVVALIATYFIYKAIRKPSRKVIGTVKELYVYPVKSCAGIKLNVADCWIDGFKWDRRWVIIDERNAFLTSRSQPTLALVQPTVEDNQIKLTAPEMPPISMPIDLKDPEAIEIELWKAKVTGVNCGKEVGEWFSKYLNKPNYKLLFKADDLPNRFVKNDPV